MTCLLQYKGTVTTHNCHLSLARMWKYGCI